MLARLGVWFVHTVLGWLLGVIGKIILEYRARRAALKQAEEEAARQTEKLKAVNPETPAEKVDEAIDDATSKL